jgi:hypothetical protein
LYPGVVDGRPGASFRGVEGGRSAVWRREAAGGDISGTTPMVVLIVGRLEDRGRLRAIGDGPIRSMGTRR